ncbi:chemotaxis protein CheB [Pararhodospirillum photometricum]|uniref:chemotaxis protein CheB n=1 Tax=Pararhodospirillum photometricum TaxID=1084 RepID=UPI001F5AD305|nr:chemotaxis protein CheB [Pararhodospirillum photometricum]
MHTLFPFPVVGIGASAGGLEALERFIAATSPTSGMAFIIVQHLDPKQKSLVPALLQRITLMPVGEASDGMVVEPNHIYVLKPHKTLSIAQRTLFTRDPVSARPPAGPIDHFFCSLAEDVQNHAVGVILSGMGDDGTQGMSAIRAHGGITAVQDPAEATFPAMPKAAMASGGVDIIAPADALPRQIQARLDTAPIRLPVQPPFLPTDPNAKGALDEILALLHQRTGNDFSVYKTSTLIRRIDRRVALHRMGTLSAYARYVHDTPRETALLFKELLIGVTRFFRDPLVWAAVATEALPALLANRSTHDEIRAWVPACSTGEEAYSLAIAFTEALDTRPSPLPPLSLRLYATDLDPDAIERARQGFYPESITADVSPERLARFFVAEEGGYRIIRHIRDSITFAEQNIISDPSFTHLDFISCRNVFIYLDASFQKKIIPIFHYCLNPNGLLLLGSAESIGEFSDLFSPFDRKLQIYRRENQPVRRAALTGLPHPSSPRRPPPFHSPDLLLETSPDEEETRTPRALMERLLLNDFCPAAVLVNANGDILYVSGRTGKYLEPAMGKANLNVHAMARDGLRRPLAAGFGRLAQGPVILSDLTMATESGSQKVTITLRPLTQSDSGPETILIVFSDDPTVIKTSWFQRHKAPTLPLERPPDGERILCEIQDAMKEMKSKRDEQQKKNEDLQAKNEELSTSIEEMLSLNEELHSVNAEMQSKIDDLLFVNNDMNNLLGSTEIATVFLDSLLNLRRYTPHATTLFRLLPGDVGRPLSDIANDLIHPTLEQDAWEVLRTLVVAERQVPTRKGRWIMVRTMPYRTQENVIDGVVITFLDMTEVKTLELELLRRQDSILEHEREPDHDRSAEPRPPQGGSPPLSPSVTPAGDADHRAAAPD